MKKNSFVKDAIILFVITLILGISLSVVNAFTSNVIKEQNEKKLASAYEKVCEGYKNGDDVTENILSQVTNQGPATLEKVLMAKNEAGENIGYITITTANGFGGPIKVVTGFDNDLKITGISYPETVSETPGLGMKVTDPELFAVNYIGKTDKEITDGYLISGASISSKAVREQLTLAYESCKIAKGGN